MVDTTAALRQGEDKLKNAGADLERKVRQGEEQAKNMMADLDQKFQDGKEKVKAVISDVDKQLHENPWPIVAGVAASCLFMGFIMGTTKRNS